MRCLVKPPHQARCFLHRSVSRVSASSCFLSVRRLRQQVVIMDNELKNSAISYIFLYCYYFYAARYCSNILPIAKEVVVLRRSKATEFREEASLEIPLSLGGGFVIFFFIRFSSQVFFPLSSVCQVNFLIHFSNSFLFVLKTMGSNVD